MSSLNAGMQDATLQFAIIQADLIANNGAEIVSPVDGYISNLRTIVQSAVTTGGTVKVQINGVDVPGLSLTVANAATKGTRAVASNTPKIGTARKVVKGDRISVVTSGFASAGALNGALNISAADTDGVMPF